VAKVKVVNTRLDSNLNGTNFNNIPSETIFSFGRFNVTSNFDGRTPIDYTNELSSFVRAVTLETMGVTETQSQILHAYATNAVLNLDKSDLNTFVRYGSAYEFLRLMIEGIILAYPGSLFMSSQMEIGGNITYSNYSADTITNTTTFTIPIEYIANKFGLVYNDGNQTIPDDSELKNLNLSYDKYVVWSAANPTGNSFSVIGFTGFTTDSSKANYNKILLKVSGNPFPAEIFSGYTYEVDFHIKPNNFVFEEFRALLNDYQKYIVSERDGTNGFKFVLKDPTLLEDGSVVYGDSNMLWSTGDKYNIDIDTPNYRNFLNSILNIGSKYDAIKTDLIARFLTPASLKTYDLTEEGKMTKLLRIYGREFDELRQFIDSLVNINKVTYNKINNIPDQLVKNLARTFGWDYFSLVNENELVESFLTIDDSERNLNTDLLPAEIDIELWRRILINTNYFWKSKGTREAIKSMFLLIGIPEPFINITEYVYTVDGKINPNTVPLTLEELPSASLPYDKDGYPVAPIESSTFYFQVSGDTDSGQAYMNVFRMVGFDLTPIVDNKKSWVQAGAITRIDDTTPQYYQEDSKLVLNTKEVDVALDTARGIEYDVYDYIKNQDFKYNSSGYTLPFTYVNISLGVTNPTVFPLPPAQYSPNKVMGDLEVRFNGILLNGPKSGTTTGITYQADYSIDYVNKTFTLLTASAQSNTYRRDVIQATFVYSGGTEFISGISVQYLVTRVRANLSGTEIPLPSMPRGDVQVTINGVALTKGTPQFSADYVVDAINNKLIIQNVDVISYLSVNPDVQVAYLEVIGSDDINVKSEIYRVDSFNTGKLYYNSLAGKFVYKLNYKVNNASEVKLLIDGIALEPGMDYNLNVSNPYEIFLPSGIKYGTVISAYYLVGGVDYFNPIVGDVFGLGDISQLSFLEFIELLQRKMINVRNRKTVSDFKGGWYPTLLNVYLQYLKRANIDPESKLHSNGYTFENLYSFLSKYNAFFQKFVDQLLSATIILKKGGLLIRNSVFTKQKFTYKRGVNLYSGNTSAGIDMRGMVMVQYFGDDGSEFIIAQSSAPPPLVLHVDTKMGMGCYDMINSTGRIEATGGVYISGHTCVTDYGMEYKCHASGVWSCAPNPLCTTLLSTTCYPATICDLNQGSIYDYRAIIKSDSIIAYGDTLTTTIPIRPPDPIVITPTAHTITGSVERYSISETGGFIIPSGLTSGVTAYGMQYSAGTKYYIPTCIPLVETSAIVSCTTSSLTLLKNKMICDGCLPIQEYGMLYTQNPALSASICYENPSICKKICPFDISDDTWYPITISGLTQNTNTYYKAYSKNEVGVGYGLQCVTKTCSTGKPVEFYHIVGGCSGSDGVSLDVCECGCLMASMSAGESYNASLYWRLCKCPTAIVVPQCFEIIRYRSGICTTLHSCTISSKSVTCNCSGTVSINVLYGDCIHVVTHACTTAGCGRSMATVSLSSVSSSYGFISGSNTSQSVYTCPNLPILIA